MRKLLDDIKAVDWNMAFNSALDKFVRWKMYVDHGRSYWAYGQFIATVLIFLKVYEDTTFGVWFFSFWWAILGSIIMVFVLSAVWGRVHKLHIRPREQLELAKTNKILMEIHKKIVG